MPFDASPISNPLNLTPEALDIFGELLAWLDAGGDQKCRFDYRTWLSECGTSACIGGWLEQRVFPHGIYHLNGWFAIPDKLGLSLSGGHDLFFGSPRLPTSPVAARCVRHMLATGEVDWGRAFTEENG